MHYQLYISIDINCANRMHLIANCGTMSEVQVAHPDLEQQRYQALLCVTDSVSLNDDPNALVHEIAKPLMATVSFDFLHFVLHDPITNSMCLKASETLGAPPTAASREFAAR